MGIQGRGERQAKAVRVRACTANSFYTVSMRHTLLRFFRRPTTAVTIGLLWAASFLAAPVKATGITMPPYPWEGNCCVVVDGNFPYVHFVWC
jgi:hypothetical protein